MRADLFVASETRLRASQFEFITGVPYIKSILESHSIRNFT